MAKRENTEVRIQNTEDRRQKTKNRRQNTKNRKQKTEFSTTSGWNRDSNPFQNIGDLGFQIGDLLVENRDFLLRVFHEFHGM